MFTKQKIGLLAAAVASISLTGVAGALTTDGLMTVSAVVTSACSVSAATLTFPTFSTMAGAQTGNTGTSLQIACSSGLTPVIFSPGLRAMVNGVGGVNSIAFNLSLTTGGADDLGTDLAAPRPSGLTADGAEHAVVLYAMAPRGELRGDAAGYLYQRPPSP